MKVLFLTDGGKEFGFGHVSRCIALSQGFEEQNIDSDFFVHGDHTIDTLFKNSSYVQKDWKQEIDALEKQIQSYDIVVIDSYHATKEMYEKISQPVSTPIFFDDTLRIDYPSGYVINGAMHAEKMNYNKQEGLHFLLGPQYLPLRQIFWDVSSKKIKKDIQDVLILLGSIDNAELLKNILNNFSHLQKHIVLVDSNYDDQEVNETVYQNLSGNEMKQLMIKSDIAISAGGQTLYELARMGIPTISICTAENQLSNVNAFQEEGIFNYAGKSEDESMINNLSTCLQKLMSFDERVSRSKKAQSVIDGQGARNIVRVILSNA